MAEAVISSIVASYSSVAPDTVWVSWEEMADTSETKLDDFTTSPVPTAICCAEADISSIRLVTSLTVLVPNSIFSIIESLKSIE